MKIVLVLTDSRRKNLVFVSDKFEVFPIEEAITLADAGKIEGAHVVQKAAGAYIRTNPSVPKSEEFENLSVTGKTILSYLQDSGTAVSTPALTNYLKLYLASVAEGEPFIKPDEKPKVLTAIVKEKLLPYRSIIFTAAKNFDIDPCLLGAIIIDEIARLEPFEEMFADLGARIVGVNTSIGIAQVKIDTAHNLIKIGLYHPNQDDKKLPFKRLDNVARVYLYNYLIQPKHNIFFAAAHVRSVINDWRKFIDLTHKPAILATLYSLYKLPHGSPEPNKRGLQIANEFYSLAKKWLK